MSRGLAEPRLRVYADATALIGLGRIGRLDLRTLLPTPTYVTGQVWEEAAGDPAKPGVEALIQARDEGLLTVVEEGDPAAYPQLDAGESTVLSAAATVGALVLIDERKARTLIEADPHLRTSIARAIGVVGLVLLAKRRGQVAEVRPILDHLMRESFRLAPGFYEETLRQAGEL